MTKGGGRLADWPVHQFCQVLRRLSGQSSFEQICPVKIRPKIGRRKPGNNGLCGHHTEASMHPGSSALHPLLCGGSSTTSEKPAAVFFFSSAASLPQQSCHVRSEAAQVPIKVGAAAAKEGPSRLRSRRQV